MFLISRDISHKPEENHPFLAAVVRLKYRSLCANDLSVAAERQKFLRLGDYVKPVGSGAVVHRYDDGRIRLVHHLLRALRVDGIIAAHRDHHDVALSHRLNLFLAEHVAEISEVSDSLPARLDDRDIVLPPQRTLRIVVEAGDGLRTERRRPLFRCDGHSFQITVIVVLHVTGHDGSRLQLKLRIAGNIAVRVQRQAVTAAFDLKAGVAVPRDSYSFGHENTS